METKKPAPTGPGASSRAKPITVLAITMGVAAAGILTPFVSGWESGGKQYLTPYPDIVGVWTQCDGETLGVTAASPKETPEGCAIKLDKRLAGFAQGTVHTVPART
jgi:lysozyme